MRSHVLSFMFVTSLASTASPLFARDLVPKTGGTAVETAFIQPRAQFERAIREMSSAPHFVLVTVVDDRTGEQNVECMPGPIFVGAILKQLELNFDQSSDEKAIQIALANTSHVFHFSKQAAFDNLPKPPQEYASACRLIQQGYSVFMGDMDGQIHADD